MNKFLLILSAFALIVSVTVCASHAAHASTDKNAEISISIDIDSHSDNSLDSNGCEMSCGGCCVHNAMNTSYGFKDFTPISEGLRLMPDTALFVSDVIYGLKRPPKT